MWATYDFNNDDENNAYHVVPLEDDEMHDLSRKCTCKPIARAIDEISTLIVHNSYDGREGYEQALEYINPNE